MRKMLFTLIFILAGTSAFALPIKVGDDTIDVYASVRAVTVFNHTDPGDFSIASRSAGESFSQMAIALQSNSRIGARWTRGNFHVHNELGIGTGGVSLRLMYADYRFNGGDSGRIRFGQIPAIAFTQPYYDVKLSWDNGLQGYGTMQENRRVGINYEIGGFSISALSMQQYDATAVTNVFAGFGSVKFSEVMPRFEVAYSISDFKLAGSFVSSSVVANLPDATEAAHRDNRYNVNAGHVMFAANPRIANNTRILASGFYSVNAGLYGHATIGGGFHDHEAVNRTFWAAVPHVKEITTSGDVKMNNTSVFGGAFGFLLNAFEVGLGIQHASNEGWRDAQDNQIGQTTMGVYANYKYRVSNFRITPEFRYLYSGDRARSGFENVQDSRGFQVGVQFRMDI